MAWVPRITRAVWTGRWRLCPGLHVWNDVLVPEDGCPSDSGWHPTAMAGNWWGERTARISRRHARLRVDRGWMCPVLRTRIRGLDPGHGCLGCWWWDRYTVGRARFARWRTGLSDESRNLWSCCVGLLSELPAREHDVVANFWRAAHLGRHQNSMGRIRLREQLDGLPHWKRDMRPCRRRLFPGVPTGYLLLVSRIGGPADERSNPR